MIIITVASQVLRLEADTNVFAVVVWEERGVDDIDRRTRIEIFFDLNQRFDFAQILAEEKIFIAISALNGFVRVQMVVVGLWSVFDG